MKLKQFANPFAVFAIAWLLCLYFYSLNWATIFPLLSSKLFIFLSCLIVVFMATSIIFNRVNLLVTNKPALPQYKILLIFNILLFASNFLYSGIPVIKGIRVSDFGIPTIIVISVTLNGFTSVYLFYLFLITKRKKFLLYISFCLCLFILSYSRGNFMMSIVTMFFLWINVNRPILTIKKIIVITSGLLLIIYLFGVAGNYRSISQVADLDKSFDTSYNSNLILTIGGESDSFKENIVPNEFFWTYIYITSPLSNLQYNINKNDPAFSLTGILHIMIDELSFDAVSKRINTLLNRKKTEVDLLIRQLTVSTTLAGSYYDAGWPGMIFFMVVFWLFPFLYSILILKNPLGVIGISTLCTVYFFSIFDNMFILTGLTLQIFCPILLNFLNKINFKMTTQNHH